MAKFNTADFPLWLRAVVASTLALFVVNLFFFLAPAISFFSSERLSGAIGTLAASFIGAFFAFQFARYQRAEDKVKSEVAAGNLALFILTKMYSETRQYQTSVVAPFRNKPDAWLNLNIGPTLNRKYSFNIEEISFILDAEPSIFADVILEESSYLVLADLIDQHKQFITSTVWPKLESAGLQIGDNRLNVEIEKIVGPSAVSILKTTTSGIIEFTDENEKSLLVAFKRLRSALKSLYRSHRFIDFTPKE